MRSHSVPGQVDIRAAGGIVERIRELRLTEPAECRDRTQEYRSNGEGSAPNHHRHLEDPKLHSQLARRNSLLGLTQGEPGLLSRRSRIPGFVGDELRMGQFEDSDAGAPVICIRTLPFFPPR